ncbi:MAG: hypothetical protein LBJ67_03025 [Planctomycetaceae bacterium]|jgi:hypothetical protein|nr:hypothetical protein [Planctomycetaceae bacterium]
MKKNWFEKECSNNIRRLFVSFILLLLLGSSVTANVTISLNAVQTGPVDPAQNNKVRTSVNINEDATYSVVATYNGEPTLNDEEKITDTTWHFVASTDDPSANASPSLSVGDTETKIATAHASQAGVYFLSFTMKVEFIITEYEADGTTVKSTRTDGPYSGSISMPLNVTNGQLKITLIPADNFAPQRSYTTFGLGEVGAVDIQTVPPNQTIGTITIMNSNFNVCSVSSQSFTIKKNPGAADITVATQVNGIPVTETIGLTAIAPSGAYQKLISHIPFQPNEVGAGFYASTYLLPKSVSFSQLSIHKGSASGVGTGSQQSRDGELSPIEGDCLGGNGDINNGCKIATYDEVTSGAFSLNIGQGTFLWAIPLEYQKEENQAPVPFITLNQSYQLDGQKGCTISKGGVSATRVPIPKPNGNLNYSINN